MTQQEQAPRRSRPRPTLRTVQVAGVEQVTPNLVRVRFSGEELNGYTPNGPAEHIRIWFPQTGYEKPVLPEWTDNGPVMPEGHERPVSRVYTPRGWFPATGEVEVDFILHDRGVGPGSDWAREAAPGQFVTLAGPAGPYPLDPEADCFVLAADHAGLPAVQTILQALPASAKADVYIEVPDAAEEQPLSSAASVNLTWLHCGPEPEAPSSLLASTLESAVFPGGRLKVFVACEATRMRQVKRHLLTDRGLAADAVYTHGYWKHGDANHPDHDHGDDE